MIGSIIKISLSSTFDLHFKAKTTDFKKLSLAVNISLISRYLMSQEMALLEQQSVIGSLHNQAAFVLHRQKSAAKIPRFYV